MTIWLAEIKEFVKSRLALYKYPRWIEFIESLPKNDRGKIDLGGGGGIWILLFFYFFLTFPFRPKPRFFFF